MPITIGKNIVGLQAQRRLEQNSTRVSQAFERLSSGLRVNRASDDAAGLAIASDLNMSTRVFTQAIRNGNDGLSVLSIADAALANLSEIVVRIRELASQASNGAYTGDQRKALNGEAQALSREYSRIIQGTSFNNSELLDGSLGTGLRIQLGFGENGGINARVGGNIGTGQFSEERLLPTSNRVATNGDVNGDGIVDIVSLEFNRIDVRLGVGDGTFSNATSYSAAGVSDVAIGDVNGDGALDIVALSGTSVSMRLNNGNGTYGAASSLSSSLSGISDIGVADVTGDGVADIVLSGTIASVGAVSVRVGTGNATFGAEQITATGGNASIDLAFGDLNGDGRLDVAVANSSGSSGTASFLVASGTGGFSTVTTINIGGDSGNNMALGDIDGDGRLDMVAGNNDNDYTARRGNGDGTFGAVLGTGTNGNILDFALRDINADGRADLVGVTISNEVFSEVSQGDGTLGSQNILRTGSFYANRIVVDDFNGDGVFDLLTADTAASSAVYLGLTQDGTAPLLPFSLSSKADAMQAAGVLDNTLNNLSKQRGVIGAFQSRILSALNTLSGVRENYASASSRIVDSDVAEESSRLVRAQILQQAAASVLSQGNRLQSIALQLLRDE